MIAPSDASLALAPLQSMANRVWDVIVVGAGPAGASAAATLARSGMSTLLVDRAAFPRWKVCGCCVNPAAIKVLHRIGGGTVLGTAATVPLECLRLAAGGWRVTLPVPGGVCVSREVFDSALVKFASSKGAVFLSQTRATLNPVEGEMRRMTLTRGHEIVTVTAKVVFAADGLGGGLLDSEPGDDETTTPLSRIGCGVTLPANTAAGDYESGTIHMACGVGGYVGIVRLEDGRLDIAAAFDVETCRLAGGPGTMAERVITSAGFPTIAGLAASDWRGTPRLTRHRTRLGFDRVLAIGDAAGYVEPFTGEGIAWALWSGVAAAEILIKDQGWTPDTIRRWTSMHQQFLGRKQRQCAAIARVLRHQWLATAAVAMLSASPFLARPVIRRINSIPTGGATWAQH